MNIDMTSLARHGAEARLQQLQVERELILRIFPDLRRASGSTSTGTSDVEARQDDGGTPRRKPMSPAEKKAVSARMKRYWASRRQAKGAPPAEARAAEGGAAPKRVISAEGRARIAEAQKKRWAAAREAAKPTEASADAEAGEQPAARKRTGRQAGAKKR